MATHQLNPLTKKWLTYNTKNDKSNTDQRYLVNPSQNTLIYSGDTFGIRNGFVLQSPTGTNEAVQGSYEWGDSTGDDLPLKAYNALGTSVGTLKVWIASIGTRTFNTWESVADSLSSVALVFSPYWDDTEKIDRLLYCDGSANQYDWSGALATLSSITATTVTLEGTSTFGQRRFLTTNTRSIRIKDDLGVWHSTVYTGGEGTATLTGLGTDLTSFPFTGGNIIMQDVITRTNVIASTYKIDFLKVIDNQVWNGSRSSNKFYVSKNTSVTDYTFSTPRAVGEGFTLTLDGPGRGVDVLRGDAILFAGKSYIYKSVFNQITVGSSLAETVKVTRIKTTSRQSALHHNLLTNIGNGITWIGQDNVLYELTDVTLSYNPDLRAISDPIKPDFDGTDFTGGHVYFYQTRLYISAPASSVNYIHEYRITDDMSGTNAATAAVIPSRQWYWQPPQVLPVKRWTVINSSMSAHSSSSEETYTLFSGRDDNGKPIHAIGALARWNGGAREILKLADEMFNEGSITANTVLGVTYDFDLDGGVNDPIYKEIDGSDESIIYASIQDPSLGNAPLGDVSLSGDITDIQDSDYSKFRNVHEINVQGDFFDYGVVYETNDIGLGWRIMSHSSNATLSTGKVTAIKN